MDRQELVDTLRSLSEQAEQNELKKVLMPQVLQRIWKIQNELMN